MPTDLAGPLLQAGAALVAAYGAVRCTQLQRYASDRRLTVLAAFFGLFAVALAVNAVWQYSVQQPHDVFIGDGSRTPVPPPQGGAMASQGRAVFFARGPLFEQHGPERVDVMLATHHLLMLTALIIAVWAFGRRRPVEDEAPAAAFLALAPFTVVGNLVPLMLGLEAGLTLYLAIRAIINHVERKSPGALQVAFGFLLFFLAHLTFYLRHNPGTGRSELGDVLNLVGIVLLVQALPARR